MSDAKKQAWEATVQTIVAFADGKLDTNEAAQLGASLAKLIAQGLDEIVHPVWEGPGFTFTTVEE